MTTFLTTTRLWESDDSVESMRNRYRDSESRNLQNSSNRKDNISRVRNKKIGKLNSRTNLLAVPKRCSGDQNSVSKTNGVKKSALLYEITERTKRLARPKVVENFPEGGNKPSRISLPTSIRVSERFKELSRPKTHYNPPEKYPGYVAPSALRAVATKRIVELATPRKTRTSRPRKKKLAVYAPCSSRISYLARPKNPVDSKYRKKNYLRRSQPSKIQPQPWKLPETRVWKELGYSTNVVKSTENKDQRTNKKRTRKISGRKSGAQRVQKSPELSQSNCSVFSFTMLKTTKLKHRRKIISHGKRRRFKRRKFSK